MFFWGTLESHTSPLGGGCLQWDLKEKPDSLELEIRNSTAWVVWRNFDFIVLRLPSLMVHLYLSASHCVFYVSISSSVQSLSHGTCYWLYVEINHMLGCQFPISISIPITCEWSNDFSHFICVAKPFVSLQCQVIGKSYHQKEPRSCDGKIWFGEFEKPILEF